MGIFLGLMIPLFGTAIGSAMVFFMKSKLNEKLEKVLLGFAGGVMVAASFWSLIVPAMNMAEEQDIIAWLPVTIGFVLGIAFLLLLDRVVPHIHIKSEEKEGLPTNLKKSLMMFFAVTLHNLPEGMAAGVALAGAISGNINITLGAAIALSIGIAIQNFPEGAIISMPLKDEGMSTGKAFVYGTLSGIVEPIGGLLTILITSLVVPILPYLLSFAAGAMMYVVVEELIPESQVGKHSNLGTIGFSAGFLIMMILDVALG